MSTAADKRAALIEMLREGTAFVHLDARVPGVRVPAHLAEAPGLRLSLSYKYDKIGFLADREGFRATLSFCRTPFRCIVPWSAVWALTQGTDVRLFGDAMPPEAASAVSTQPAPRLRLVN